jgi:putative Mn2+ efflux pump MntP
VGFIGTILVALGLAMDASAVSVGIGAGSLSLASLRIGHRLGVTSGKRVEVLGGLVLIGIGLRIQLSHAA